MSQPSIKSLKIAAFREFFKRLYSEQRLQKAMKSLLPKISLLFHKLKRVEAEQKESFNEIAAINSDSQADPAASSKAHKNQKSPLSTIIEQSDQNASDNEEQKTIDSMMAELFALIDSVIPNENKIINQYKLELKNLAMEIQDMEENQEKEPENNNNEELNRKSQENLEFFKRLYEKENQKLTKLSKRFEALQTNFDNTQDLINILQVEKEKLMKELEKEKKLTYKLQNKKEQEALVSFKEKSNMILNSEPFEKKLAEKDCLIADLQKQLKHFQNSLTKARSDLALANDCKSSFENDAKMLKNVKDLLEKDNEKLNKLIEKKEKYIKELLIKVENPIAHSQKIALLEENIEVLKQQLQSSNGKIEELKTQVLDLQFINKSLYKKEEVLDLKHQIDQLEYRNMLKDEEIEGLKQNNLEKVLNMQYLLEADRKRIRELEENLLRQMKENKLKEEEVSELRQIIENYNDIGKDFKGIKKKLFNN